MGTRGAIGFRSNQLDRVTYNHFDSYPDALGEAMIKFVKSYQGDWAVLKDKVNALRLVQEGAIPSAADKAKAKELALFDGNVAGQSDNDWYCLLRNAQGNLKANLKMGVMIDSHEFLTDSLFCEYAYIINLDDMTLEFYEGFNKDRSAAGRYAALAKRFNYFPDWKGPTVKGVPTKKIRVANEYAGVRFCGSIPLALIQADQEGDWKQRFYPKKEEADTAA